MPIDKNDNSAPKSDQEKKVTLEKEKSFAETKDANDAMVAEDVIKPSPVLDSKDSSAESVADVNFVEEVTVKLVDQENQDNNLRREFGENLDNAINAINSEPYSQLQSSIPRDINAWLDWEPDDVKPKPNSQLPADDFDVWADLEDGEKSEQDDNKDSVSSMMDERPNKEKQESLMQDAISTISCNKTDEKQPFVKDLNEPAEGVIKNANSMFNKMDDFKIAESTRDKNIKIISFNDPKQTNPEDRHVEFSVNEAQQQLSTKEKNVATFVAMLQLFKASYGDESTPSIKPGNAEHRTNLIAACRIVYGAQPELRAKIIKNLRDYKVEVKQQSAEPGPERHSPRI